MALTDVEPTLPVTVGLAAQVEQRDDLQALVRDLHALSDDQRAALVLSELGDLDHEQIANVLGVRRARVATLVFQARASLMETRKARDTSCSDIQEQLATLRGGALRRSTLRRHVEYCPACQAFRAEVRRQRAAIALILPVVPSLGLKRSVLARDLQRRRRRGRRGGRRRRLGRHRDPGRRRRGRDGAVASSPQPSPPSVVAVAPAVAAATAVAAGVICAGVAAGGAAVAAAGGAAVAAKALGVKVLLAAAIASGGPGLQAAAEGLGVAEKLRRHAVGGHRADAVGRHVRPGDRGREGRGLEDRRHRARRRLLAHRPPPEAPARVPAPARATSTTEDEADSSASETGSGAGAMPGEVIDAGASTSPPADPTPPAEIAARPRRTARRETASGRDDAGRSRAGGDDPGRADPPPAETTSTPDPPPATTTREEPPPAETTTRGARAARRPGLRLGRR